MAANDHAGKQCRLILVASPLQGHMTPILHLATYLNSINFSVTVAHSDLNPPNSSTHPDFAFIPLADKTAGFSGSMTEVLRTLNDNCKPGLREYLVKVMDSQKGKESVVVVYDSLMFFAGSVALEMGLPAVVVRTSSAASFPAIKIIPRLYREGRFPPQDSLLQEIVPELEPFRYKDLPFINLPIEETLETINMITLQTTPSAFIWNTLEFLEQPSLTKIRDHYQVPIFTIGPLHQMTPTRSTSFLEEDATCIPWLEKQAPKSVIYVSLGSLATINEKVSIEMAWGLANSSHPFLWVVRPGSVRGFKWVEFLPQGLESELKARGLVVKWAPQKEVLAHNAVGGFWSHCGWNSILESVSEGVPMLCQPFDIDQRLNARNLSYVWNIGVEIEAERAEIREAVRKILVGKEGEEMKKRAMEIQEKVKLALSDGGSSKNSLNDLVNFIMSL